MPNRILKESICISDNLNELAWQEEVLFYRLLVHCDDYGRMDGRPAVIRARCFPLSLQRVSEKDIIAGLASLREHNLIQTYNVNGNTYLQVVTWNKHQQIRAKRSKYPVPPADDSKCKQMPADDNICSRNPNPNPNPNLKESIREKRVFGEFKNVFLTEEQYQKLKERFGETLEDRIQELSEAIASKGYKYKDHYATILSWDRKKAKEQTDGKHSRNPRSLVPRGQYTRPEEYHRSS